MISMAVFPLITILALLCMAAGHRWGLRLGISRGWKGSRSEIAIALRKRARTHNEHRPATLQGGVDLVRLGCDADLCRGCLLEEFAEEVAPWIVETETGWKDESARESTGSA